jgi:integrase
MSNVWKVLKLILAIQLLRDYLNGRRTGRVFQTSRGTPLVNGTVNVEQLRPLLKRLKIPHGTLHSFRHARVSHLRRQGVPDPLIKKWVGHSSLRMTFTRILTPSTSRKSLRNAVY